MNYVTSFNPPFVQASQFKINLTDKKQIQQFDLVMTM